MKKKLLREMEKMKKSDKVKTDIDKKNKNAGRKIFDPVTKREREHNKKLEEE